MKPGFLETTLDTRSANGRDDVLLSELRFIDLDGTLFRAPPTAKTNGASTPRFAWLIPGFEPTGRHWFEWILHDSGYGGTLEVFREGAWRPANLSRLQCDELLRRTLVLDGMHPAKRGIVFYTVRAEGWRYYQKP